MGNEACLAVCREHDGEGVMLSDINHENDKPKGDFATYIGKETYGIACDASHVLHTFEKESKQVGLENL